MKIANWKFINLYTRASGMNTYKPAITRSPVASSYHTF